MTKEGAVSEHRERDCEGILSIPGNRKAFDMLKTIVASGQALAFVGAGASAELYPLWQALLRDLARLAVETCKASDEEAAYWIRLAATNPDRAARRIKFALGNKEYANEMYRQFEPRRGSDGAEYTLIHELLMRLPFQGYITTNYDTGLHAARIRLHPDDANQGYSTWKDEDAVRRWIYGDVFERHARPILSLHGIYDRADTILFDEEEYQRAYSSALFHQLVESLWKRRLVFIGCSFSDRWFRLRADLFHMRAPQGPNRHVAILGLREDRDVADKSRFFQETVEEFERHNTVPCFYQVVTETEQERKNGIYREDHSQLATLLRCLLEAESDRPPELGKVLGKFDLHRAAKVPANYVEPKISWSGVAGGLRETVDRWLKLRRNPIVLLSPPGMGKSLALSQVQRYVEYEWRRSDGQSAGVPVPAVLFNLGLLAGSDLPEDWPWRPVREAVKRMQDCHDCLGRFDTSLVEHRTILLLDGLDELTVMDREKSMEVLNICKDLAEDGFPIVVSCRTWQWKFFFGQDVRQGFEVAELQPFDDGQALELLRDRTAQLPREAFQKDGPGALQPWLRSPQLLQYFCSWGQTFTTKSELFHQWVNSLIRKERRSINESLSEEDVHKLFQTLAVTLAQHRTQNAARVWNEENIARFGTGLEQAMRSTLLSGTFAGERTAVRFSHALLWEYFVAAGLAAEFRTAIESTSESSLESLALAQTALDFVPSSVYGFLHGRLGASYQERLVRRLAQGPPSLARLPPQLVRNLVEYLGKTSPHFDETVIGCLLGLAVTPAMTTLVRYNALRALERTHPSAPTPYFDFASDWGVVDWSPYNFDQRPSGWLPFAIRGHGLKERRPGPRPRLDIDFGRTPPKNVQRYVSEALLDSLRSTPDPEFQINCTHALVRWFDFHSDDWETRLTAAIRVVGPEEAKKNLDEWVRRAVPRFRAAQESPKP